MYKNRKSTITQGYDAMANSNVFKESVPAVALPIRLIAPIHPHIFNHETVYCVSCIEDGAAGPHFRVPYCVQQTLVTAKYVRVIQQRLQPHLASQQWEFWQSPCGILPKQQHFALHFAEHLWHVIHYADSAWDVFFYNCHRISPQIMNLHESALDSYKLIAIYYPLDTNLLICGKHLISRCHIALNMWVVAQLICRIWLPVDRLAIYGASHQLHFPIQALRVYAGPVHFILHAQPF